MTICFDMDGTIANFYGVKGWLNDLENESTRPYEIAKPLVDMEELHRLLMKCRTLDINIHVITWVSKNADTSFAERIGYAKLDWLDKYRFPYDFCHIIPYGESKSEIVKRYLAKNETALIFDDDARVRANWLLGEAIDPTTHYILEILRSLF